MQTIIPRSKWVQLLLVALVFAVWSWLAGGPVGNVGSWLMVVLAIVWAEALADRRCATHPR